MHENLMKNQQAWRGCCFLLELFVVFVCFGFSLRPLLFVFPKKYGIYMMEMHFFPQMPLGVANTRRSTVFLLSTFDFPKGSSSGPR